MRGRSKRSWIGHYLKQSRNCSVSLDLRTSTGISSGTSVPLLLPPLTTMTKRNTARLSWSTESRQAFDELRTLFTSAPILRHPDPKRQFIVEVDASNTGVGAILLQHHGNPAKMFPCAFFSRKLTAAECNYDVGNRKLPAMNLALEEWRQ